MKRIFFALLLPGLLAISISAVAQKVTKHYTSQIMADGIIYHLFSQNLLSHESYGDLSSDITYKTNGDGKATLNFTYHTPEVMRADSIHLISSKQLTSATVTPIYIERSKKNWDHRYTCQIALSDLQRFFSPKAESSIKVWSSGNAVIFRAKRSEWEKYTPSAGTIFQMIRMNEE